MEPRINILNEDDNILKFRLSGVDVSLANAIRRIILSDIPCYVFRTTPYSENKATIFINTSDKKVLSLDDIVIIYKNYLPIDNHFYIDNIGYIPFQNIKILISQLQFILMYLDSNYTTTTINAIKYNVIPRLLICLYLYIKEESDIVIYNIAKNNDTIFTLCAILTKYKDNFQIVIIVLSIFIEIIKREEHLKGNGSNEELNKVKKMINDEKIRPLLQQIFFNFAENKNTITKIPAINHSNPILSWANDAEEEEKKKEEFQYAMKLKDYKDKTISDLALMLLQEIEPFRNTSANKQTRRNIIKRNRETRRGRK